MLLTPILLAWAMLNALVLNMKPLHKLVRNKKGAGGVIVVLISMMVMILVGIIVVQALITSQTQTGWSTNANTTWTNLQTNIWTAFGLIVVGIIIVGAVAILSYLRFGGGT